jgi:uncharacterized phage infection (PIP) family protein YhgE
MRSAEAAKNTANLIEESVKNAEGGVAINAEVLKNLEEINGQVRKVSEMVGEISAGSEQQSEGVDQINTAIEQMNQVTQSTAASAEESASAAEEMSGQAEEMRNLVSAFKLSNAGSGAAVRPVQRAAAAAMRSGAKATTPLRAKPAPAGVRVGAGNGHGNTPVVAARPAYSAGVRDGGHGPKPDPKKAIPFDDDDHATLQNF